MRRFTVAERRARLGRRHRLAAPGVDPVAVVDDLVAVHATDPASAYLSVLARLDGGRVADVERALYDDRTLVRLLGMRRTVFVTALGTAGVVQSACAAAIAEREGRLLSDGLTTVPDGAEPATWLDARTADVLAALDRRGEATAAELVDDDPRLAGRVDIRGGSGHQTLGSRLLFVLSARGQVVRGRPRGSWNSQQYRWATARAWCGGLGEWATADAEVELARRWLAAYGPATVADLVWWTGWTLTRTRAVLARLRPAAVELPGPGDVGPGGPGRVVGLALPDDLDEVTEPAPWVALLPALDATAMGWKERDWYLDGHGAVLTDRSGNIGPTLWCDGRVVGGWVRRGSGDVVTRLLVDLGDETREAVDAAAARLEPVVADVPLAPRARVRSALEQELFG